MLIFFIPCITRALNCKCIHVCYPFCSSEHPSAFYWKNNYGSYKLVRGRLIEAPNQESVPTEKKLHFKLDTNSYKIHNPANIEKLDWDHIFNFREYTE